MTVVRLPEAVEVVNVGLPLFADAIRDQQRPVVHVDWRIPAGGDPGAVAALTRLHGVHSEMIEKANAEVYRRLDTGVPVLLGVEPALSVVPGLSDRMILHCGPAIAYSHVCDPLRRSMRAAVVAEGWAPSTADADVLLERGSVTLAPANEHSCVVPMATALGPSAPVFVVSNADTHAFAPVNQGPGEVAWFGRDTDAAIARLLFLRDVTGPVLDAALGLNGPVDVMALAAQGVAMGDDVHMRTQATTNLFIRNLLPALFEAAGPRGVEFARYLAGNHLFFLNIAMAGAKSLTLSAEQVYGSSIVTTMARNGTSFGIKLAGNPSWFTTAAPPVGDALFYSGYGPETAANDIGDSAVLELMGLGGPAAAGSPAVAAFLGGTMADARRATEEMIRICHGPSTRFKLATMDFRGTPVGVDVRYVAESGITPKVNTGILHATEGAGQIGAGVATAPVDCFLAAMHDLETRLSAQ